jgi:hypothetical protein
MPKKTLEGARILLVQSDPIVALSLAELFADIGAEVVTTFGLPETFHEIAINALDGAIVHLDLDGTSALPAAVLLHESGTPLVVVSHNHMSAFLARHLPGAVALEPGFEPQLAVAAVLRAARRRGRPVPALAATGQAPQRQNRSPSWR